MIKCEQALLAKLFFGDVEQEKEVSTILDIPSKYWSQEGLKVVMAYKKQVLQKKPVMEALSNPELEEIIEPILELDSNYYLENVDLYIQALRDDYFKRRMINLLNQEGINQTEEILKLSQEVAEFEENNVNESSMEDLEDLLMEGMEETQIVKTGDYYFNDNLSFARKNLNIIGARPGVGKSSFALHLALGMAKESKGLFFSLEMSDKELSQRIVAMSAKVDLEYLKSKEKYKNLSQEAKQKVQNALADLRERPLKLLDGNFSISQIWERVRLEKQVNDLDFIFVDYLQLVDSSEKTEYERVTAISRTLKRLAKEFDITVVALAQLNREAEGEGGKKEEDVYLKNLKGSGQIEQDGSVIVGLISKPTDHKNLNDFQVKVLKNRHGRTNFFLRYQFNKAQQVFYKA